MLSKFRLVAKDLYMDVQSMTAQLPAGHDDVLPVIWRYRTQNQGRRVVTKDGIRDAGRRKPIAPTMKRL